jgi:hypothetical protein
MRRLGWLIVLATTLGGCKKSAPAAVDPPQVVDVQVIDRTPDPDKQALDLPALTARAADAIGKSCGLLVSDGGSGNPSRRYKLRVEVRTETTEESSSQKGMMRALVGARLQPFGAEPGALSFEQNAVAEKVYDLGKRPDAKEAWRAHTLRAVEDVVKGVGARVRLSTGDAAQLVTALDGPDEDLREEAIRVAAERKERAAVPSLIKLLKSDDHDARDRAIGALQEIGDPRAVRPLTEVARFRDLSDLPKVLDALAAIGGDEARSYLEFVASGHDSVEIRDLAKQALAHLERRHAVPDLGKR